MPAEEIEDRRRRGLPDYERPPLGQPPSWLQEQERKVDPGPAIGDINGAMRKASEDVFAMSGHSTEAHPTMELRFVKRYTPPSELALTGPVWRMILQQRWVIITFAPNSTIPIKRETEWRDVPLVEE